MSLLSKYQIRVNGSVVRPLNDRLFFRWEREKGTGFFARKMTTKLRFSGAAFEWMKAAWENNPCEAVTLEITRPGFQTWAGKTAWRKMDWDFSRCFVESEFAPDDDMECVRVELLAKRNFLDYGSPTLLHSVVGTIEKLDCLQNREECDDYSPASNCLPNTIGWVVVENKVSQGGGIFCRQIETKWAREKVVSGTNPGAGWTNISGNDWARPVTRLVKTNQVVTFPVFEHYIWTWATGDMDIPNGRKFSMALAELVSEIPCLSGVRSNFLNISPNGSSPANEAYTKAATRIPDLFYIQKSDVVRNNATNPATLLEMSIFEFLEVLSHSLNTVWTVERDGASLYLRIEHLSWFDAQNGSDWAGEQPDALDGTWRWTDGETIPLRENFSFGEAANAPFLSKSLVYPSACADSETEAAHTTGQMTADVAAFVGNESASLQGWLIVSCFQVNGLWAVDAVGGVMNAAMGWNEVLPNFWRNGRWVAPVTLNGSAFTVDSTKKLRKHEITVRLCHDAEFDPATLQNSLLGWSEVNSAEWDTFTETLKLNLVK